MVDGESDSNKFLRMLGALRSSTMAPCTYQFPHEEPVPMVPPSGAELFAELGGLAAPGAVRFRLANELFTAEIVPTAAAHSPGSPPTPPAPERQRSLQFDDGSKLRFTWEVERPDAVTFFRVLDMAGPSTTVTIGAATGAFVDERQRFDSLVRQALDAEPAGAGLHADGWTLNVGQWRFADVAVDVEPVEGWIEFTFPDGSSVGPPAMDRESHWPDVPDGPDDPQPLASKIAEQPPAHTVASADIGEIARDLEPLLRLAAIYVSDSRNPQEIRDAVEARSSTLQSELKMYGGVAHDAITITRSAAFLLSIVAQPDPAGEPPSDEVTEIVRAADGLGDDEHAADAGLDLAEALTAAERPDGPRDALRRGALTWIEFRLYAHLDRALIAGEVLVVNAVAGDPGSAIVRAGFALLRTRFPWLFAA